MSVKVSGQKKLKAGAKCSAPATALDLERQKLDLDIEIAELEQQFEALKKEHQIEFLKPYWYQSAVMDHFRNGANIVIIPVSNKVGKTTIGACLVHSWALGYEPWNPVPDTFTGAVRVKDRFYMPSSMGKKPPVNIRITGEEWEEHMKKTIVPELKKWQLPGQWETSKNNQGVEATWRHKNGSQFNLMTYNQGIDSFESFLGDAWWPDEPPPIDIWSAMSRGLFMKGGKVFMSMTPLKEAWIWDDLIKSHRPDVKVVTGVTLWDCPHLYNNDLNVLMKCGLMEEDAREWLIIQKQEARKTKYLTECEKILKEKIGSSVVEFVDEFGRMTERDGVEFALQSLQIHRFIKDLKTDMERLPRVFGEPKYLMGRVWPNFKDEHIVEPFSVPVGWPVDFQIDFHPNENHAITFRTVDPWGRHFIIDEVWAHLTNPQIVDEIVKRKQRNQWRMRGGEIDALAKGDSSYVRNRFGVTEDSYIEIERGLRKYGLQLGVGSKAQTNYIAKVDEWMTHTPPLFFVFNTCKETLRQIERWTWDDIDKGHFPECIGRHSQTGLKYTDPAQFNRPLHLAECPI